MEPGRRVAIITGGSRGIGADLVAGYRARGWPVVATARKIKPSEADDLLTVAGDIADPATADLIADAALDRYGRIDTLVNNAGVFISKPFTEYTAEDYATLTGVNLAGVLLADPARHRRDGHAVRRPRGQRLGHHGRGGELGRPVGAGRPDQGRPGGGHQVAGRGVRLARHPGQRRLAGHHPDPGVPGGELRRARQPASPARARGAGQRRGRRHLVPRDSPYIAGELLHIDGGTTAGH